MMFRKSYEAELKAVGFDKDGLPTEFEGYAAVFGNIDLGGDMIVAGAFTDSLEKRYPDDGAGIPVYWNHNLDDPFANIGQTTMAHEDGQGLRVKVALDIETSWGKQVARLLKEERVQQMSFSFDVQDGAFVEPDSGPWYYELRKLDLFEVSVVPIGMNQATEIFSVKSAMEKKTAPTTPDPAPPAQEPSDAPALGRRETAARRLRAMDL